MTSKLEMSSDVSFVSFTYFPERLKLSLADVLSETSSMRTAVQVANTAGYPIGFISRQPPVTGRDDTSTTPVEPRFLKSAISLIEGFERNGDVTSTEVQRVRKPASPQALVHVLGYDTCMKLENIGQVIGVRTLYLANDPSRK